MQSDLVRFQKHNPNLFNPATWVHATAYPCTVLVQSVGVWPLFQTQSFSFLSVSLVQWGRFDLRGFGLDERLASDLFQKISVHLLEGWSFLRCSFPALPHHVEEGGGAAFGSLQVNLGGTNTKTFGAFVIHVSFIFLAIQNDFHEAQRIFFHYSESQCITSKAIEMLQVCLGIAITQGIFCHALKENC